MHPKPPAKKSMNETNMNNDKKEDKLQWWQLSMLGVAFTIGTGYFLGSGIAITIGGPAVLLSFVMAAIGTYLVFDMLARMTADHPLKGSFRSYAKKAYGGWAGFTSGWVYWSSELLIMGSQLTALSLFTRFWFPEVPLWILASVYAVLGLAIIIGGTKGFERLENMFAVIKVAAIVMFIIIAIIALMGFIKGGRPNPSFPLNEFFAAGWMGIWSSLLFAFYAFGGIEIMGIMAMRLRDPKEAPKAGKIMLMVLAIIYLASLVLAFMMVAWRDFNTTKSPFLLALNKYPLPYVPHIFNGILIIAGFSTMVASLFAVTSMLVTLAEDKDAPKLFAKKMVKNRPLPAIGLTTAGLVTSIVFSLLMPGRIYEYFTTAAGLMLLYNWFFILVTGGTLLKLSFWGKSKRIIGMVILLTAVSGALFHHTSRPGFYVSLLFLGIIGLVTLLMRKKWQHKDSSIILLNDDETLRKENKQSLITEIKPKTD